MTGLRRALLLIAAAGVLLFAIQIGLIASTPFSDRGVWIALDVILGGGFLGVGLFAWDRRPENRVGMLMVATSFAWFLTSFGYTEPALLFTLGTAFQFLFVAPAIHLLLAFPSGRLAARFDRLLVTVTYSVCVFGLVPAMLALDPRSEGCTVCPDNLLLIESDPGFTELWITILNAIGIVVLMGVLGRLIGRWRQAAPRLRRIIAPVFAAGAILMVSLAALLASDLVADEIPDAGFYVALIPLGLVPALFLAGLIRARLVHGGAVGELVARIGDSVVGDDLRGALGRALNDPSLELAYWLPESGFHVDVEGNRVELPEQGDRRAIAPVTLDGGRVAVMIHDSLLLDDPQLIDAVGGAAALALGKQRLEAELRAKVGELRESRARLLSYGLAERRRLERDLHDGAQQRLVSLALDLRLARDAIGIDPGRAGALLDGAADELGRALAELRELARGIHPAVLSDRGLDPAVEALASRAPLPVEIAERIGERVSESVELAAYFVVAEALTNVAKYAGATHAVVRVGRVNGDLRVEVADDGVGGADPEAGTGLRGLAARLSVVGGRLEVDSPGGAGTRVTARIPCG